MRPTASELLALHAREITYPGTPDQVANVRADLRPLLRDCPVADDVILCASELAANAVNHSASRLPGGTFTIRTLISRGDFIRLEVHDSGGPWTPTITDPSGHHGLDILQALATNWGINGDTTTRTAWATFTWTPRT
jgi:anti-sigma regulatory factor (Ser/Thr protein kinase)